MSKKSVLKTALIISIVIISAISNNYASSANGRKLRYEISPLFEEYKTKLKIVLSFKAEKSGVTRIELPSRYFFDTELYKGIKNLTILTEGATLKETGSPEIRLIKHKPNQSIKIQYELEPIDSGAPDHPRKAYKPIIQRNYAHFLGSGSWVFPRRENEPKNTNKIQIKLEWKNFPEEWTFANSFGTSQKSQSFSATLRQFSLAVFVAGDFRFKKGFVNGKTVYTALRGDWNFTDSEFSNLITKIVKTERDFWNDHEQSYYLVTMLPLKSRNRTLMGGAGLTNSFATFATKNVSLKRLERLIVHEYFHNWNPRAFGNTENSEQFRWFTEGFTDYYAYLLLLRSGLSNLDDHIEKYNELMKSYYLSPFRNVNSRRVSRDFFRDKNIFNLPYWRGFLLATRWNHIIRSQNAGTKSLDNVMWDIFQDAKQGTLRNLSNQTIISYLSRYARYNFANDIEKYIERGETIPKVSKELGTCVETYSINQSTFEIGFDISSSKKKNEIIGTKKNSAAYQNGVRNGQKMLNVTFYKGFPKTPVILTIMENGAQRKIRYLPESMEKTNIPMYKLRKNLTYKEENQCLKKFGTHSAFVSK